MELRYTLGQIAKIVRGMLSGDSSIMVNQIVTDSRQKSEGSMFVALRGDRFDGHDFANIAAFNGAKAVLVHKQIDGLLCPYILVRDTNKALAAIGEAKRKEFKGKIVAVTGSSGKTTTRRLLHAALSEKWNTLQPKKNYNNHIGVPLTLLELDETYDAAVLELGCSDFNEIAFLTEMCNPDVGLITNVGPAHLEKLGSLNGVAKAKGELFLGMNKNTIAVLNGDDDYVMDMNIVSNRRIVFGTNSTAEIRLLKRISKAEQGQQLVVDFFGQKTDVELSLLGIHNASNAIAAIAAAAALGTDISDIQNGFAKVKPESGRLTPIFKSGLHIIDDTYNANPSSMCAALNTLIDIAGDGKSAAVLGDMLELGNASDEEHMKIGRLVAGLGIDTLITVGKRARSIILGAINSGMDPASCAFANSAEEAAELLLSTVRPETWVLVKGSRGMKMETVIDAISNGGV